MFAGAQVSLYPMCDGFVSLIMNSLSALDPYRDQLRIETDDISTLIVGPPEVLFNAMRDLFVQIASSGKHVVMHATVSRGCPGEPDAEICQPRTTLGGGVDQALVVSRALEAVKRTKDTGQQVSDERHRLRPHPVQMLITDCRPIFVLSPRPQPRIHDPNILLHRFYPLLGCI